MFSRGLRSICKRFANISSSHSVKRTFLSHSFYCDEAWKKRLNSPILKKCVLDDFFYELDTKYNQTETINPIDVDIFVNAANDLTHLDEMQDLVHKLRLSRDSCDTLDSTHHGLIRLLLSFKRYEDLMVILNDRLNYGIFPDHYSNLLMFDTFLKLNDYKNAAKVACLLMLQEDLSSRLLRYLSLYSCHLYLLNPTEWEKPPPPPEPEDDEEIKVRVAYLRNPYFDNHFDLIDPDHLIGKTFIAMSKEAKDHTFQSYEILGCILFNKFSSSISLMKDIISNKQKIFCDVFELIKKSLDSKKSQLDKDSPDLEHVDLLLNYCEEIAGGELVSDSKVLMLLEDNIKNILKANEEGLTKQQQLIYDEWVEKREVLLKETMAQLRREERLAEVKRVREGLAEQEQALFFFDQQQQLDLEIEKKEEQAKMEGDSGVKTAEIKPEDYIPPEIVKQRPRH